MELKSDKKKHKPKCKNDLNGLDKVQEYAEDNQFLFTTGNK